MEARSCNAGHREIGPSTLFGAPIAARVPRARYSKTRVPPTHSTPGPLLLVLAGPTASGKSHLALRLAEAFTGEIVSCDSVAVYREMDLGTAKPSLADRAHVPHHLLDIAFPNEPFTAGDYSRLAREAIAGITARRHLPIVTGGTGLYLRALLDGLFPAPPIDPALRTRLRTRAEARGPASLHRLLTRFDPAAATRIHPNDTPKLVRALELTLTARRPLTEQWKQPRDPLTGYTILRLGLAPDRASLYPRINQRAQAMFDRGLVSETSALVDRYSWECRPLTSLGYAQAVSVLRGEISEAQAIARTAQGHRNFAKRQTTWFRREPAIHWLPGFGEDPATLDSAGQLIRRHLQLP